MKPHVVITISILFGPLAFGQVDCKEAELKARKDFNEGNYIVHSLEFYPFENTYLFVLREDYKIQWRFTDPDSLSYYQCYDSVLTVLLKHKYGKAFLNKATAKTDSLEKTKNWRKAPEFPGGISEMNKFILGRLKIETGDLGDRIETKGTKVYIQFTVTETGELEDIKILRGISERIDNKVVQIFEEMPNWTPAYLHGKPIRQRYAYPINIELK